MLSERIRYPFTVKYRCDKMNVLPAYFTWKQRRVACSIYQVSGRGSTNSYDIEINGVARAQLEYYHPKDEWELSSRNGRFPDIADELGKQIEKYWEKIDEQMPK